ncbi:hypothetical protein JHK85_012619 [Glycine max]|nr:hypothetical protein JHK85_012619 [Glycine max]
MMLVAMPLLKCFIRLSRQDMEMELRVLFACYLEEIKHHYEVFVEDVNQIESGCVPLPSYNSSTEGSTSHASDEGASKKGGHSWNSNNECNHGTKASRSDQEQRKGIACTEDEHRRRSKNELVIRSRKRKFALRTKTVTRAQKNNKLKRLLKRLALTDPLKLLQEYNKGKGNFTKEKKHRVVTMVELNMRYPSHV